MTAYAPRRSSEFVASSSQILLVLQLFEFCILHSLSSLYQLAFFSGSTMIVHRPIVPLSLVENCPEATSVLYRIVATS